MSKNIGFARRAVLLKRRVIRTKTNVISLHRGADKVLRIPLSLLSISILRQETSPTTLLTLEICADKSVEKSDNAITVQKTGDKLGSAISNYRKLVEKEQSR